MKKESERCSRSGYPCVYRFRSLATEFLFSKVCATPTPDFWLSQSVFFAFAFVHICFSFLASSFCSFALVVFLLAVFKGLEFALYGVDIGN